MTNKNMALQKINLFSGLVTFSTDQKEIPGCGLFGNFEIVKVVNDLFCFERSLRLPNYLDAFYKVSPHVPRDIMKPDEKENADFSIKLENYSLQKRGDASASILIHRRVFGALDIEGLIRVERKENNVMTLEFYGNKMYHNLVRLRIGGMTPIGSHAQSLIYTLGIKNNILFLHASCVFLEEKNEALIFLAPSDTGKTTSAFVLSDKYNAKLLSEDITCCVVKDEEITLVPSLYTTTYLKNPDILRESELGIRLKLDSYIRNVPIVPFFVRFSNHAVLAKKVLQMYCIQKTPVTPATVKFIRLIPSGAFLINPTEKTDLINELLFLNRAEFNYRSDPSILLLSKWDPSLEIEDVMRFERNLASKMVSQASTYVASINQKVFSELVDM